MKNRFLDIRNYGFFRVGVVSPKVFLANPLENSAEHIKWIKKIYKQGTQLVVFPELSLTGYSCQDLFLSKSLLESAIKGLKEIVSQTRELNIISIVGLPFYWEGKVFNAAVVILKGQILAIIPKTYLPDYREFRETRWFATSMDANFKEVELFGDKVPFGSDLLISSNSNELVKIGVDICEDPWMPVPPSTHAALAGATILVNLSGSNITLTKDEYRRDLVRMSSSKNFSAQLYSSSSYGESTTDVAWDGHGIIADRGNILAETKRFSMNGSGAVADIDLETLMAERIRTSSFHENANIVGKPFRSIGFDGELGINKAKGKYLKLNRIVNPHPFVPSDINLRNKRCEEVFMIQATSLARRLETLPVEKRKLTIGVSGGLDPTQALLVASKTMDLLELPRKNIIAITMPGFGTSDRTYENAVTLIKAVGATFKEIPIKDLSRMIFEKVGHDEGIKNTTYENTQAWSRKYIELANSSEVGGLVLGTGDLSELWLGWCTMFGDHASHYGVNSSVPKTLISHLVRFVSDEEFKDEPEVQNVLRDILDTPISPELLPTKKGKIVQKTEDIVGPYELHDFFGYHFVRFGMRSLKIARLAYEAFGDKYDLSVILKWLKTFLSRFFANQYKRSVLPDGPKVGSVGPSPRDEWKMPSDILSSESWLLELEDLEQELSL